MISIHTILIILENESFIALAHVDHIIMHQIAMHCTVVHIIGKYSARGRVAVLARVTIQNQRAKYFPIIIAQPKES